MLRIISLFIAWSICVVTNAQSKLDSLLDLAQVQENNANYIEYHLEDETCHVVKKPLKKAFEELEPKGFIQVHRSYLVNKSKISELYRNDILILKGKTQPQIPVSRGCRKMVKKLLASSDFDN